MSNAYILEDISHIQGTIDYYHITDGEIEAYNLIHALVKDVRRLENMVIKTREEVNQLSMESEVYDVICENVSNGIYYDLPAMDNYIEMFGADAVKLWEE